MNTWILNTHGDPLGALHGFLKQIWEKAGLDALIVSANGHLVIDSPDELDEVNPFRPVMRINTARLIPQIMEQRADQKMGVLLRPCELRALDELSRRNAVDEESLLTICVDCLGTYSTEDYDWRADRKGSSRGLTKEALKFAMQGGINTYRYRPACQMCANPGATDAEVNVGVLGLPVRQNMLVTTPDGHLDWDALTNGAADETLRLKHDQMLAKIRERGEETRERLLKSMDATLPHNVDDLIEQFQSCEACQDCANVCPICAIDHPRRVDDGRYDREDLINWLLSCAGCGMCEQACPKHIPLSTIFAHIRETMAAELAA